MSSKILAIARNEFRRIWKDRYGDDLVLMITYVGGGHKGTVYLADNWKYLGMITGLSGSHAPIGNWIRGKKKDGTPSARALLAMKDPQVAIKRYASHKSGKERDFHMEEPKMILARGLVENWKQVLK